MSQKYVIVHFVEIDKVPREFPYTEWPLHITLLANFTIAQPLDTLLEALKLYAQQTKPFEIVVSGEAAFGPKQNVAVSLIRPSEAIKKIHGDFADITKDLGAEYDAPQYMGEGFRPHATIQTDSRLNDNQTIPLHSYTLVDMYPDNNIERRKIIKTFELTD